MKPIVQMYFADLVRKAPVYVRPYIPPVLYGLLAGLAAVLFQQGITILYRVLWKDLSHLPELQFVPISLLVILLSAAVAGLILKYVSSEAAGSGIPQLKVAFWRDFGFLPFRVIIAKFFAGLITIGGGSSLGREGPTVHIAGALSSNLAGLLGVAKQARRPALLAGSAAGLAAAFNTPLSAITFVLEEIIEDLNNTRFLAQALIASVTATFVAHFFLGKNPAFIIPATSDFSWPVYFLVVPVAALAALAGAVFQKCTLDWRDRIKQMKFLPSVLKPVTGALFNWVIGMAVFLSFHRLGVFGLGYDDLEAMLQGNVTGMAAMALLIGKMAATTAVYAWGGSGGIFAPTLFFGAAAGLVVGRFCMPVVHLSPNDSTALAVSGMSACLGAVVRAPITSILIVFEMTQHFAFVPLLMIGTIASQAVSRALNNTNFYTDVIERDGIHLEKYIPPRSLAAFQGRPISVLANFSPVFAETTDREQLQALCSQFPYQGFPLILDGNVEGIIQRADVLNASAKEVPFHPFETISVAGTIREAVSKMINSSATMLVVTTATDSKPVGVVTLHDILRLQNELVES
ncbi:MAG: chloride channel protein [Verrucomicrobia bacterium]|nr:chloride channel protein [Verrucomicrobiota bacterium]